MRETAVKWISIGPQVTTLILLPECKALKHVDTICHKGLHIVDPMGTKKSIIP